MNDRPPISQSNFERIRAAWKNLRIWLILVLGTLGTLLALSLPVNLHEASIGLEIGDVAPRDIFAPRALTYSSDVLTDVAIKNAVDAVADQYDPPDVQVALRQFQALTAAFDFVDTVRADENADLNTKLADLAALTEVSLDEPLAISVLEMNASRWSATQLEAATVLEQVMRREIRQDHLEEERRRVSALVNPTPLTEDQIEIVVAFVRAYVAPNTQVNAAATDAAREEARRAVAPVARTFVEGETIVGLGELVTNAHIEALEVYGLLKPPNPWHQFALRALMVTLLAIVFGLYARVAYPKEIQSPRAAGTVAGLIVAMALGMQFMIPGRTVFPYLFPSALLPILLSVVFGPGMGIASAMLSGILAGYLGRAPFELAVMVTLGGSMGALVVGRAERLSSFLWSGLAAGVASAAVIVLFRFPDPATDVLGKATLFGASLGSGMLSAILGMGLLLPVGGLFGITTNLQLIELSRPDHPLLQFILQNAPGTYQHSLQVANLAENAARAIGANPLLTRVGALYHDAGKALHPQFFIENQIPGQNVHEQLDPITSAGVIRSHVREGIQLARKHRLPKVIESFIAEHHGTMRASFLYTAALKTVNGEEDRLDLRDFTYPGPRPLSRETALMMLSDGVEAKARADKPQNEEEIDQLVRWVIKSRLEAGQLDRTDLTLKDLDAIRRAFATTLKSIYHPRIRYPSADERPVSVTAPETATDIGSDESTRPMAATPETYDSDQP